MSEQHTGSCLCGMVKFTVRDALREVVACHCGQCRRQTGLYYAATNAPDDAITVEGEEHIKWYRSSDDAQRGFCRECGSALFWKNRNDDFTSILAGAFDQPSGLKVARHIYTADKGDFYEINDGLPQE